MKKKLYKFDQCNQKTMCIISYEKNGQIYEAIEQSFDSDFPADQFLTRWVQHPFVLRASVAVHLGEFKDHNAENLLLSSTL
jgi:hypothetical protein